MSYASIRTALGTKLAAIVGSGQPFSVLYKNFEANIEQYPALLYRIVDSDGEERFDNQYNNLQMRFVIRCVQWMENSEDAEGEILDLLDSVLNQLRSSANRDTLGGNVEKMDVERVQFFESEDAKEPIRGFDIVVNLFKLTT